MHTGKHIERFSMSKKAEDQREDICVEIEGVMLGGGCQTRATKSDKAGSISLHTRIYVPGNNIW